MVCTLWLYSPLADVTCKSKWNIEVQTIVKYVKTNFIKNVVCTHIIDLDNSLIKCPSIRQNRQILQQWTFTVRDNSHCCHTLRILSGNVVVRELIVDWFVYGLSNWFVYGQKNVFSLIRFTLYKIYIEYIEIATYIYIIFFSQYHFRGI